MAESVAWTAKSNGVADLNRADERQFLGDVILFETVWIRRKLNSYRFFTGITSMGVFVRQAFGKFLQLFRVGVDPTIDTFTRHSFIPLISISKDTFADRTRIVPRFEKVEERRQSRLKL
jgi:hypothetical protein